MTTLKSKAYAEAEAKLLNDPTILGMASEVKDAIANGFITADQLTEWKFVTYANKEYLVRGGTGNYYIGTVSKVIQYLVSGA
jgi:hypothetical protein